MIDCPCISFMHKSFPRDAFPSNKKVSFDKQIPTYWELVVEEHV